MSIHSLHIRIEHLTYRGETRTGNEFDRLIIAAADGNGKFYRFLFDEHGNHAVSHPKAKPLSEYFGLPFKKATLDGEQCLVHIS